MKMITLVPDIKTEMAMQGSVLVVNQLYEILTPHKKI